MTLKLKDKTGVSRAYKFALENPTIATVAALQEAWIRFVEDSIANLESASSPSALIAAVEALRLQAQTLADDIKADLENSLRERKFKSEREMEEALEGDAVYNQVTAEERAYTKVLKLLRATPTEAVEEGTK